MLINILTQITNNIWRYNEYTNIKYIKTWELLEHSPIEDQIRDVEDTPPPPSPHQPVQSEESEKTEESGTTQSTSLWSWLF